MHSDKLSLLGQNDIEKYMYEFLQGLDERDHAAEELIKEMNNKR